MLFKELKTVSFFKIPFFTHILLGNRKFTTLLNGNVINISDAVEIIPLSVTLTATEVLYEPKILEPGDFIFSEDVLFFVTETSYIDMTYRYVTSPSSVLLTGSSLVDIDLVYRQSQEPTFRIELNY